MGFSDYKLDSYFHNADYFSIKNITINIPLNNTEPINIISYTCNESIKSFSISGNSAMLTISLCFKILYTTQSSHSLNILKYNCLTQEFIHLPNKIDGFFLHKLNIKKKFQANCSLNSLSLLSYHDCVICFSLLIFSEVIFTPSLSIIYKINSSTEGTYLYSSNTLCEDLLQLNFIPKIYEHICFSPYDDSLFYFINNTVYSYSLVTRKETALFNDNFLSWFYNIAPSKFIIYRSDSTCRSIIISNTFTNEETLLYKCEVNYSFSSFMFSSNILSFVASSDTGCYLIILNIYGDILFNNYCEFNRIFINPSGSFALGFNDSTLQIIDVKTRLAQDIPLLINNFLLNDLVYLSDNIAIICGTASSISYILSFDIKTLCFTELFRGSFSISSISIDNRGGLFFTSNELGLYNVYNLKPGFKPTLSLKLFANNLSLLIRT